MAVTSPLGDDVLLFHNMTASEQLGRLFQYELDLLSVDAEIKLSDILAQCITVRYQRIDGEERYYNGFVNQFSQEGMHGSLYVYRASLRPWFWFLTRTADCRIFQNKTVPDIIKEVFRDKGFSDFEDALCGTYKAWENCVQYRETDFNFVSRLMEQEGIYYYFRHEQTKHILVLSDSISAHDTVPGYEEVPYFPPEVSERRERDHLSGWSLNQVVQPGSYVLNDYDFKKPKANLEVKSLVSREHDQADYEVYDYPGEYCESAEGESYVRTRIEELQAQHEEVHGHGNAGGLTTGCLFQLSNYPREDQNREYLLIAAKYSLGPQEYESSFSGGGSSIFSCDITAIDKQRVFRAPRITPKPVVQGPQTAVVVGKAGEEIWTDEYGRVKVQFHWDRYGKEDENSSCWMRVSQVHAGKGFGGIDIPRIGEEVIVSCLEGDPDQPIITGRVYNSDNKPPTGLPGAAMVSGLKSNSTPGGGGNNSIMLDDTRNREAINMHAQHNMSTIVENNQSTTINSGNRTLTVKSGTNTETIKGDATLTVQAGSRVVGVTGGDYVAIASDAVTLHGKSKGVGITGDVEGVGITGNVKGVGITGTGGGVSITGIGEGVSITGNDKGVGITGNDEGVGITGNDKGVGITGTGEGVSITGDDKGVNITGNTTGVYIEGNGEGVGIKGEPDFFAEGTAEATLKAPVVNIGDSEINIKGTKITIAAGGGSIVIDAVGVTIQGTLVKIN